MIHSVKLLTLILFFTCVKICAQNNYLKQFIPDLSKDDCGCKEAWPFYKSPEEMCKCKPDIEHGSICGEKISWQECWEENERKGLKAIEPCLRECEKGKKHNKGSTNYTQEDRQRDQQLLNLINTGGNFQSYLNSLGINYDYSIKKLLDSNNIRWYNQNELSKEQAEQIKRVLMDRLKTAAWNLQDEPVHSFGNENPIESENEGHGIQPSEIGFRKGEGSYATYHTNIPNIDYYEVTKDGITDKYYFNNLTNERLSDTDFENLKSEIGQNIKLTNTIPRADELVFDKNNIEPIYDPLKVGEKPENADANISGGMEENMDEVNVESGLKGNTLDPVENVRNDDHANQTPANIEDRKLEEDAQYRNANKETDNLPSGSNSNSNNSEINDIRLNETGDNEKSQEPIIKNPASDWLNDYSKEQIQKLGEATGESLQSSLESAIKSKAGKNIVTTAKDVREMADQINGLSDKISHTNSVIENYKEHGDMPDEEILKKAVSNPSIREIIQKSYDEAKKTIKDVAGKFYETYIQKPMDDAFQQ